jgi:hypothetical protein
MGMNPVGRKLSDEDQKLVDEYLKKGGTIKKGVSGRRTEDIEFKNGFYGKRKKQSKAKQ